MRQTDGRAQKKGIQGFRAVDSSQDRPAQRLGKPTMSFSNHRKYEQRKSPSWNSSVVQPFCRYLRASRTRAQTWGEGDCLVPLSWP